MDDNKEMFQIKFENTNDLAINRFFKEWLNGINNSNKRLTLDIQTIDFNFINFVNNIFNSDTTYSDNTLINIGDTFVIVEPESNTVLHEFYVYQEGLIVNGICIIKADKVNFFINSLKYIGLEIRRLK